MFGVSQIKSLIEPILVGLHLITVSGLDDPNQVKPEGYQTEIFIPVQEKNK